MHSFRVPADKLEYTVLATLWELGTTSIRDIHDRVGAQDGLVYTTIAKVFDRLRHKGLIKRRRLRHRVSFVYSARVVREEVERIRVQDAVRRFLGPKSRAAVAALVEAVNAVDPGLLDELERAVATHRKRRRRAYTGTRARRTPPSVCIS